jgi:hypothetical protein
VQPWQPAKPCPLLGDRFLRQHSQGLCNTLHRVQPRSLRLNDFNNAFNNLAMPTLGPFSEPSVLVWTLKGKWTRLFKFRFPYEIDWNWTEKEANKRHLLASFLKIIYMPGPYNPNALRPLLAKPSLCAIVSETPFGLMQGHHIRDTTDQLPIQLCNNLKTYFPLPGPWAPDPSCRPYEAMEAGSK